MLYLLGFFSGFAAILYQIVWMRSLGLLFGSTAVSIGVSLAAFMAGLGAGGIVFGRAADRSARPARLYALLEIGIGVFGFFSPYIFSAGNGIFHVLYDLTEGHPALKLAARAAGSFGLLLIPTVLMGGTFPAAVRALTSSQARRGGPIGWFYAVNTLGAAAAAILFPLVIAESVGMAGTLRLAAVLNLIAATGAWTIRKPQTEPEPPPKPGASPYIYSAGAAGAAMFLSGFCALALETLFNRVLIGAFGSSIYSFSFILGVFLTGIAAGSHCFSAIEKRFDAGLLFFSGQLAVAAGLMIILPWIDRAAILQLFLFDLLGRGFLAFHAANMGVTLCLAGLPAFGFGLGYPAAMKMLTGGQEKFGMRIGIWSAVNAAGTTLGSITVTFFFMPAFGSYRAFQIVLALLILSLFLIGAGMRAFPGRPVRMAGAAAVVFALHLALSEGWDVRYFHMQTAMRPDLSLEIWKRMGSTSNALEGFEIVSFREGTEGTVSVAKFRKEESPSRIYDSTVIPGTEGKITSLYVNGKIDASDNYSDMVTQSMLGHLPMQFHPAAKTALVVGLGSGVTAAALAEYPIEKIDAVEISPDVARAADEYFSHVNHGALRNPKVRLFVEDGRALLSFGRESYDLIVSEPSNVWISGSSSLFTREYFSLIRSRLNPGGVLCKWFHSYSMSWENLLTLLSTLQTEFPYYRVFNYELSGDLLIIAADHPIGIGGMLAAGPDGRIGATPHLAWIKSLNDLLKGYVGGSENFRETIGGGRPIHTDDRPLLELRGPKDLFLKSVGKNYVKLVERAPESTIPLTDAEAARILGGGRPAIAGADWAETDSGVRVIHFMDDTRTSIQTQSFQYRKWTRAATRDEIESLIPLFGNTKQSAHRLTLSALSGQPVEMAREFSDGRGHEVTAMEKSRRGEAAVYLGFNCDHTGKTVFFRHSKKAGSDSEAAGPRSGQTSQTLRPEEVLGLVVCRSP